MTEMRKLQDIAQIDISNVDKKSKGSESLVRLCNFVDVYRNWEITEEIASGFMIATANNAQIDRFTIHKGQVAITKDSETRDDIGISTYVADKISNTLLGYHCALITPDERYLLGSYLNVVLHTSYAQKYFEANASGSGQRYTLTDDIIGGFPVPIPSISEQKKISNIFSCVDRIVQNNKAICADLEAMAKLVYDYWFVQFDFPDENGRPYKSSGGKMVWNEELKREIPDGWEVKTIKDLAIEGKTTAYTESDSVPTMDLSVMPSGSMMLSRLNDSINFCTNLFEMKKNDILFGAIRPYLKKAGIAPCDGAVAGTIHCFRPQNASDYNFLAITICNDRMFQYAVSSSQGTKMPVVTIDSIMDYKVAYDNSVSKKFNRLNFKEMMSKCILENQQLASLRDFLLPMLMNGQVTVGEMKE